MFGRKLSTSCAVLVSVLWLLLQQSCIRATNIECIPLKLCPMAMKLIKTKPYSPETIEFLRNSHCGSDVNDPKVWCPLFLFCKTPDSRDGVCKEIRKCDAFVDYMHNVDTDDRLVQKYLQEYRCSTEFDPEIRICCPDEGKILSAFKPQDVHERFSNFFHDADMCGKQSLDNKIVGGTKTSLYEFPWLTLLKYVKNNNAQFGCAGSLIHERFVLTAGHCVDPDIIRQKDLGKLQSVILGEYDTRNETDCIYQKFGQDCADLPQEFGAEDYIIHPNYDSKFMLNDIAVIRLKQKAVFTDYVQPICLPPFNFNLKGNETFMISGWGRTDSEKRSPIKRKARVKYVDQEKCDVYNGKRRINNRQICAGEGNGVNNCYGDSGGPLMLDVRNDQGFYSTFAVGIVSYGYGWICGGTPGVYTYLPPYMDWIYDQIQTLV